MDTPTPEAPDPIIRYIRENRDRYTRDAMRTSLIAAGNDALTVDAALDAETGSAGGAAPPSNWVEENRLRLVTAGLVTAAYAGVWILFALLTNWNAPGYVTFTTWVFGAVLGLFGLVSLVYVAMTRRLTAGGGAAILGAMTIPVIILLVLAGLCVPFTRFR